MNHDDRPYPTLFAAVALVATILAFCLLLVGRSNRRDNPLLTGCGLLMHALAYVCYTVYAQAPLWVSYGLGNSLLSLALAFYTASLFRVREQVVPWRVIFVIPACMLLATLVLMLQCSMILYWAWRHAERPGRAHLLLQIGALISLVGLGMRVRATRRALPVTRSNCASASACGVVCRAPKTAPPTCWPKPMRRCTRPRPPGATRCTWRR